MGAQLKLADLPDWPAALTMDEAIAFTGMGEAVIRQWSRSGKVRFLPRGPKGALVALKTDLQAALADMFTKDVAEDLDFG
jgi:hypothetical protein